MGRFLNDYGMIFVLLLLCAFFSALTLKEQRAIGSGAGIEVAEKVTAEITDKAAPVLIAGKTDRETQDFAGKATSILQQAGYTNIRNCVGSPRDLVLALKELKDNQTPPSAILVSGVIPLKWRVFETMDSKYPEFKGVKVIAPRIYTWPDFLKLGNMLAVVDRIVVIAVIAIGMTMVIITGGIDLSVGSLIALAAVISTLVMKRMGGIHAGWHVVLIGFIVGIAVTSLMGTIGGWIVARFKVAPFITTLALMMVARGLAFLITGGYSIYQVPKTLTWLGQGYTLGIPNTVILLVVLYIISHIFMAKTKLGRYIYAVGGNTEAARLSGVPVRWVIIFVYFVSACAAGLGGCIQASQLNTGTPNCGVMFEMYVIAAVVVGGTSLAGGSGRIFGTLIGAFIISVIQNGMNLLGIESYTQQVVLGLVILAAVLLDKFRSGASFKSMFAGK